MQYLSENDIIFKKEFILNMSQNEKEKLPFLILNYIREKTYNDFPYPEINHNKIKKDFISLSNIDDVINNNENILLNMHWYYGTSNIKSFYPNIYESNKINANRKDNLSSIERFYDDNSLLKVIQYRCGLNNSKNYKYIVNGKEMYDHETFDITMKNIRIGINSFFYCEVSVFPTRLAKMMINTLINLLKLNNKENIIIYDPFGGWGSRMFASSCFLDKKIHYIYHDSSKKSVENSIKFGKYIKEKLNHNFTFECNNTNFDVNNIPQYDICITCPPYKNLEIYDNNQIFDIDNVLSLNNSFVIYNNELDYNRYCNIYTGKSHFCKNKKSYEIGYLNIH